MGLIRRLINSEPVYAETFEKRKIQLSHYLECLTRKALLESELCLLPIDPGNLHAFVSEPLFPAMDNLVDKLWLWPVQCP